MKIITISKTLLIVLISGWSLGASAQCPNVVWSDEFTGTSLDQNNWNVVTGNGCSQSICGWGNNELQSYQASNLAVSNGMLEITAKKERVQSNGYTSGRINSMGKGDFTYGRFESRIKLPDAHGLWPAFWMLPTDNVYGTWPQSGEIDIMEFTASKADSVYGTIHYGTSSTDHQYQSQDYKLLNGLFPDTYHDFAIEWEVGEIRWYIDDVLYSTKTSADISPYSWPFDQNFYFVMNVAVGGNLGGTVDDSMLPSTMYVDYVRVYNGFKPSLSGDFLVMNQAQGVTYAVANLPNNTSVTWTVPAGATIASGQGSNQVTVDFGGTSGYVTATFDAGCGSETISIGVEVEPPYVKSFSFENFDDPSSVTLSSSTTGTLTAVNNPAPNTVNSTATVGEYVRNSSQQYDILVYGTNSTIADANNYSSAQKKFFMDVYTTAPVGTEIIIQLETSTATSSNYPTGRHSRYTTTIAQTGSWQHQEFRLLDQPDPSATSTDIVNMILLFNSNTYTGDTYYIDNLDSYVVDTGTTNQPPTISITSPADGSTYTDGTSVALSANASDSDGSVSQVEFFVDGTSVGVDISSPYSVNWTVTTGTHTISATATDDQGATANASIGVTGQSQSGTATSVHVSAIVIGSASAGKGSKNATASVTIVDDLGNPVSSATVSGTFSGTFSESVSAATDASGVAILTTSGSAKGSLTVNICVDNVTASLTYVSGDNVITCTSGSARLAQENTPKIADSFKVYPNPVTDYLHLDLSGLNSGARVRMINLSGKEVFNSRDVNVIDMTQMAKGFYLLEVSDGSQTIKRKIIK